MPTYDDSPETYGEIHVTGQTRDQLLQLMNASLPAAVREHDDLFTAGLAVSIRGGGLSYSAALDGMDLTIEVSPVEGADIDVFGADLARLIRVLRASGAALELDLPPFVERLVSNDST